MKNEKSTAKNIKSDSLRKEVERNLERCIQRLKEKSVGGFALFSGKNGLYEIEVDIFWYYRCQKTFQTQILDSSLCSKNRLTGVIAMDITECGIGLLEGMNVSLLETITSGIQSKHRAGGQSSQRFKHLREEAKRNWFKRIANHAREYFLDDKRIDKIIIHGESFTKREFLKGNYLEYRLQKQVELSDGCYAGEDGMYELFNKLKYNN